MGLFHLNGDFDMNTFIAAGLRAAYLKTVSLKGLVVIIRYKVTMFY